MCGALQFVVTDQYVASGTLQIRQCQGPHSCL